jgi:hypothetical protein
MGRTYDYGRVDEKREKTMDPKKERSEKNYPRKNQCEKTVQETDTGG